MKDTIRRVGFDARLAGSAHAGIGRYEAELLRSLLELTGDEPVTWVVFVSDSQQLPWLKDYPQVEIHFSNIKHYSWQEQIIWWWQLQQAHLDLLHVPHFNVPILYQGNYVVTIHDLLWHSHRDSRATTLPAWQHRLKYGAYRWVSAAAMRRAQRVFVPTRVVAQQVKAQGVSQSKILVTREGVSEPYASFPLIHSKQSQTKKERASYFVYTGSLYPHKNVEVALVALQQMPDWRLHIVTARNVFTEIFRRRARELGVLQQVSIHHALPDQDLIALYQDAVALVQPSTAEGFGLTGLEAMAVGCSVIASDIPVFDEVYQEHALRFDLHSSCELAQRLIQLQQEPPSLKQRQAAQRFAQAYQWEPVAQKTWDAYQKAW